MFQIETATADGVPTAQMMQFRWTHIIPPTSNVHPSGA